MIDFTGKTVVEAAEIALVDLPDFPGADPTLIREIVETRETIRKKRGVLDRVSCRNSILAARYARMLGASSDYIAMRFETEEEYRTVLFRYQLTLTIFTLLIVFKNKEE